MMMTDARVMSVDELKASPGFEQHHHERCAGTRQPRHDRDRISLHSSSRLILHENSCEDLRSSCCRCFSYFF
jgi:hypothetical protein